MIYNIVFFGDSICVGQGVSIYRGWVVRLAEQLETHFTAHGNQLLVTNASVNGRTTRQALEDMPYHVQSRGVDLILVQFGLNDCNYWLTDRGNPRVSLPAFKANLHEIVTRAKTFGAKRILLNTNHPTTRDKEIIPHTTITYEQSNRAYNEAIRELAAEIGEDVVLLDVERMFLTAVSEGVTLQSLLLDDGLHLSNLGHDYYLNFIAPEAHKACLEIMKA
ncbi:SGNH/GDSL hydrolase family protein [uncultured Alsobacter sp.]|uniref:SGNH/GDSL hydrolase family protein n=1 Tax=uncultured Alsobacter sp. TaxID=1748258 RepID=UPI0025CC9DAF|nr:SGNH/GDSL hydrolase family protein [uncultured Alsobacter sp.]